MGAVAREPIEAEELFASIPNELIFAESNVLQTPIAAAILSCPKFASEARPFPYFREPLTSRHILYVVMMVQRHDPSSFWGPYLRLIPDTFSTTAWYSQSEMDLLVGTNLYGATVQRKHVLEEAYNQLFPALTQQYPDLFPAAVCTLYVYIL